MSTFQNNEEVSKNFNFTLLLSRLGKRGGEMMMFIIIFFCCGFATLSQVEDRSSDYFKAPIKIPSCILNSKFSGNYENALIQHGLSEEAKKHGILLTKEEAYEYVKKLQIFQTEGHFDKKKYDQYLLDNNLSERDLIEYGYVEGYAQIMTDIINFNYSPGTILTPTTYNKIKLEGVEIVCRCDSKQSYAFLKKKKVKDAFITHMIKQKNPLIVSPETRTGKVLLISLNEDDKKELDNMNIQNLKNLYNDEKYNNQIKCYSFDKISLGEDAYSDFLFFPNKLSLLKHEKSTIENHQIYAIGFVDSVDVRSLKPITTEINQKIEKYISGIADIQSNWTKYILMAEEYSRNKTPIPEDLIYQKRKILIDIDLSGNNFKSDLLLATIEEGKAMAFLNSEDTISIFICDKKTITKHEIGTTKILKDLNLEKYDNGDKMYLMVNIKNMLHKWIDYVKN